MCGIAHGIPGPGLAALYSAVSLCELQPRHHFQRLLHLEATIVAYDAHILAAKCFFRDTTQGCCHAAFLSDVQCSTAYFVEGDWSLFRHADVYEEQPSKLVASSALIVYIDG